VDFSSLLWRSWVPDCLRSRGCRRRRRFLFRLGRHRFVPMATTRHRLITALRTGITGRNGSVVGFLLGRGRGSMDRITSMGTSIIVWTTGRGITVQCRSEMSGRQSTGRSFTGRRCMMRTGMRRRAGTDRTFGKTALWSDFFERRSKNQNRLGVGSLRGAVLISILSSYLARAGYPTRAETASST